MLCPALLLGTLALAAPDAEATGTATAAVEAPVPRIDLISIGTGSEMYAIFGHAAIRAQFPDGRDIAYNFGGVDIEQPNFWSRVVQGRLEAYLEITSYSDLLLKYSGEDRTIVGRKLSFTPEQTRALIARLEAINASEDRTYIYHHVYENCTTKIAEVFDEVLAGQLSAQSHAPVRGTHREWIMHRLYHRYALYVLMDLVGNGMGDVPIDAWDRVYIPEGFDYVVDHARIDGQPFVTARYIDYKSMTHDLPIIWEWPWTKVYLLFVLPLVLLALWRARPVAAIWGLLGTVLGLVYLGFWLGTDYEFYHGNWNMLIFPPTHAFLLCAALSKSRFEGVWAQRYLLLHAAIVVGLVAARALGLVQQAIDPMLGVGVPLALVLLYPRVRKAAPSSLAAPG